MSIVEMSLSVALIRMETVSYTHLDYFICTEQSVGGNYLSSDDYGSSSTIPTSVLRKRLKLLSRCV